MTQMLIKYQFQESYDKKNSLKCFIGYSDNNNIRPLCIKLPQMIGYAKYFDDIKTMSFRVIDKELVKKYTKTWGEKQQLNE